MTRGIEPFALKEFFYAPEAGKAEINLSKSFAEPMSAGELLALEEGAAETLHEIGLGYPAPGGSRFLREAIAAGYRGLDADDVSVMGGLDEVIAMLALALLEPGDRIVVHMPCYQSYMTVPAWHGAEVVPWHVRPEAGWAPDLGELDRLLETPTRWVIANFPHNPTGFMPDRAWFDELVRLVEVRGTLLLCDEIYSGLSLAGAVLPPAVELSERAVSMNSVSKRLGVPGLRVGWIASRDAALLRRVKALRDHFNNFTPAPSEFMASIVLRHADEVTARNAEILKRNAGIARSFFDTHVSRFAWHEPLAGVNAFPMWLGNGGTRELSANLLEHERVLVAPSAAFDAGDAHMRLGLGCRDFEAGLERFDAFLARN